MAMQYGDIAIFSCYISPNCSLLEYEEFIDELDMNIKRCNTRHILLGGDFNAKSVYWGCATTDKRGECVESWAATSGLILLNIGQNPTCIRHQGDSIIDLTWSTPELNRMVVSWKVDKDILTLSNHRYLVIELKNPSNMERRRNGMTANLSAKEAYPKWSHKEIDTELFAEALEWECSNWANPENGHAAAYKLKDLMTNASDLSMKRTRKSRKKIQVHWWSSSLEEIRKDCIVSRRKWTRAKKKKNSTDAVLFRIEYKKKRKILNHAIFTAKEEAWKSLLQDLDDEPWGMAFKMVLNKFRMSSPALTEILEPEVLEVLI